MADPLSIASGIIAVLQAAESLTDLLKKAKAYWAASDEVLALINEISDVRLILNEHNDIADQLNHIRDEPRARLRQFLDDTKDKLFQIEGVIQGLLVRSNALNDPGINKFSWVRKKSQVDKMRRELKDLRQNIVEHFAVINLHSQSRIGIRINQIAVDTSELRNQQHESETRVTEQFTDILDNQQQIIQRVDEAEISVLNLVAAGSREHRAAQLQIEERLEDTEGLVLNMLHSQQTMQNTQRMMHDLMLEMSRVFQAGSLMGLLGQLFFGYAGLPISTPPCDYQNCSRRIPIVQVIYAFPLWFLARVVFLNYSGGLVPRASLKVLSYLTSKALDSFVMYASQNNIKGIQQLLTRGLMSPESIGSAWTPLAYAANHGLMEVCELLLAAGADPTMPHPDHQMSALDVARRIQFSVGRYPLATVRKARQLFPRDEDEFFTISTIHRIVLGISQQSLTEYFCEYNGPLDHTKQWGHTALEWAVLRKDHITLRSMLQHEKNEETRRSLAESTIFRVQCVPCLKVLLATSANINACPWGGVNIIINALTRKLPREFILELLKSGVDPNSWDETFEKTVLMHSCFDDRVDIVALLIDYGADVNLGTPRKQRVWMFAIWLNAHKCLKLFLRHGLDLSNKHGSKKWTVLHAAASCANIQTMEILAGATIRGVDVDDRNASGEIAREYLRARKDYSPELHEAFEALVFSIRPSNEVGAQGEDVQETHETTTNARAAGGVQQARAEAISEEALEEVEDQNQPDTAGETPLGEPRVAEEDGMEDDNEDFEDAAEYLGAY